MIDVPMNHKLFPIVTAVAVNEMVPPLFVIVPVPRLAAFCICTIPPLIKVPPV
jgi:hypothetical protein